MALRVTHRSTVTEEQIDHLGHMNVMWYAVNATAGTAAVLVDLPGWGERPYFVHDVYTRHHREQLLGAELEVRSALLASDESGVRIHHELVNVATEELAATFVHRVSPVDPAGARVVVPADALAAAALGAIEPPHYAATRSITLDVDLLEHAPPLEVVRDRRLEMRKARRITVDELDGHGDYRIERAAALMWGGEPLEGREPELLEETDDGLLIGWAIMETRIQLAGRPLEGTRIQSFGAGVAMHEKVVHRLFWAYDLDSGEPLGVFEAINLAFDVRTRRPVSFPDHHRRREEARIHPDLAPS